MRYTVKNTAGQVVAEVEADKLSTAIEQLANRGIGIRFEDLEGADLRGADMIDVYFRGADLIDDNTTDRITDQ